MEKNAIFITMAIFYSVMFTLMGTVPFTDVSADTPDLIYSYNYTLNASHSELTYCEFIVPFIGQAYIVCEDGKSFNLDEITVLQYDDLIINEADGFIAWVKANSDFASSIIGFLEMMFSNFSGLPTIVNALIFTPLGIIVIWLMVELIIWIIPFIG